MSYRESERRDIPQQESCIPVDAVLMAGGKGNRLRPLTEKVPKPLLKVDGKPILEHLLNRLFLFGMNNVWISVNYLGEQIEAYFSNGYGKNLNIEYVWEEMPLGSMGAVSKIKNFKHEYVLVSNADVLTDLDYKSLFTRFVDDGADLAVVTIPYTVDVPYGVLAITDAYITGFKEKPSYTYNTNGGIYLMKRAVAESIPENRFFNATDLIDQLISDGKKVLSYQHSGYWQDVGDHEELEKAKNEISQIQLNKL